MAKVLHPYTGIEIEMPDSRAAEFVAMGYKLAGSSELVAPVDDVELMPEPIEVDDVPNDESTISEIKAFAKAHGINLPRGNKAALLDAINASI